MKRYWKVTQQMRHGVSRARIQAPDYFAALQRATEIGFSNPDSLVLEETPAERAEALRLARSENAL